LVAPLSLLQYGQCIGSLHRSEKPARQTSAGTTAFLWARRGWVRTSIGLSPEARGHVDDHHVMENLTGKALSPPTKTDAERRGVPAISMRASRPSSSSKKIRISRRARC